MPYGNDDPWLEQARAAASMPAMNQVAGYPFQPYQQVTPGFGGYGGGHVAADLLGGVMNAWIGRQVNKHQELQTRAQNVFNLHKLGYDLGQLLEDPQNRAAVEKTMNVKLPKNLIEGGYGPPKSSAQLSEEATRNFLRDNAGTAPQAAQQMGVIPQAQAQAQQVQNVSTAPQAGPSLADLMPLQAQAQAQMQANVPPEAATGPEWAQMIGLPPQMARVALANPEIAGRLGQTAMTVVGGLAEAQQRAASTMAVARMEQSQKGLQFMANMRMQGIKDLGLVKEAADNLAVSLVDPNVPLTTDTQKAIDRTLSSEQRQTQGRVIDWLKEAFPNMRPDQAVGVATAAAKGFEVQPEWLPPGSQNMLAQLKAAELGIKQIEQQKGAWDIGEKAELTVEGKKVTMPMYLAGKAADISKTMAEYDLLRRRVPNIDAIAQMLKSESVVSKQAKTELIKKVMRDMGMTPVDQKTVWDYIDVFGLRTPPVGVQPQQPGTPADQKKAKEVLDRLAR